VRVLFLCPNVPYPPLNGGHHRNLGLIRSLARFAAVEVLAIGVPEEARTTEARDHLRQLGVSFDVFQPTGPGPSEDHAEATERPPDAAAHFRSPALAAALARRLETEGIDVVHIEEIVMAQYLDRIRCPRVIDRQKVDWAYHEAMARVAEAGSVDHMREAARFLWWERRLAGAFDRILVPGDGDRRLLEPVHGAGSVSLVPIAIEDDLRPPPLGSRRVEHVVLYGALDYGPNVEAQKWFFREVWPLLQAAAPRLRVRIVGSGRPPLWAEAPPRGPTVEVLGFVADVRPVLQGHGALVVGVQVGGGARTKILEALACGMPVISTRLGVENLDLVPGRDFLLAETAADVANCILRLSRDGTIVEALAREGAARAAAFRWSRVEKTVAAVYEDVLAPPARVGPAVRRMATAPVAESSEFAGITARIEALRPGPEQQWARAWGLMVRRIRRSVLASWAGRTIQRLLDRLLTPARGGPTTSRLRRGLARVLRAWRGSA
jgi:glycosyltransferase involved in cell wall biosynthesis